MSKETQYCMFCGSESYKFYSSSDIMYYSCKSCDAVWLQLGDLMQRLGSIHGDNNEDVMTDDVFNAYIDSYHFKTMDDLVVNCIVCGCIAYETVKGTYVCSNSKCKYELDSL